MFLAWVQITSSHEYCFSAILKSDHIGANILHSVVIEFTKLICGRSKVELLKKVDFKVARVKQLTDSLAILEDLLESYAVDSGGLIASCVVEDHCIFKDAHDSIVTLAQICLVGYIRNL